MSKMRFLVAPLDFDTKKKVSLKFEKLNIGRHTELKLNVDHGYNGV